MENNNHKGSEYNNIIETWEQNERRNEKENVTPQVNAANEAVPGNDLEQLIKQEATEYDNVNKEDRILSGDRATINDEPDSKTSDE